MRALSSTKSPRAVRAAGRAVLRTEILWISKKFESHTPGATCRVCKNVASAAASGDGGCGRAGLGCRAHASTWGPIAIIVAAEPIQVVRILERGLLRKSRVFGVGIARAIHSRKRQVMSSTNRSSRVWVALRAFGTLFGLFCGGCGGEPGPATAAQTSEQPVLLGPESTARAEVQSLRSGPRISGALEPRDQATITAELSGAVRELKAELGQKVQRGQVLVQIDPGQAPDAVRSARAALQSAEQALQLASSQVERSERLVKSGALAENQLEVDRNGAAAAQAQLQQAQAQLATANDALAHATVRAPMTGVVSVQRVHAGDIVVVGSPLLTVIDPSSMRLEAAVPASALADLAIGTKVEFEVRAAPDQVFEGSIERIAPAAEAATGLITILVSIPNTSGHVLAGLFADGRVALEAKDALAIPVSAMDRSADPPQVTRIRDQVAKRVPVELGMLDELKEQVEVRSGLREGDRVALGTARDIVSGTPVRLVGAEPGERSAQSGENPKSE